MSSEEFAIKVQNVSKCYEVYSKPIDRFKQFFSPFVRKLFPQFSPKFYKEFWALRDVSFEVRRGQTFGILGRNGSGKSTLLQIICGTLHPSSGQIQVNGRVAALLELGSGFNPEFTGRENVYLNAGVLGLTHAETQARFLEIESFADIGDFIDQPVKTYSSGMLVRLAFAVIAHVDADVLVIDEALAVGDAFFNQKCMRFLRNFMKTNTVLFVSHDLGSVKSLCSEAIWIEKGQAFQQGLPKDICDLYLQAFYEADQGKGTSTRLKSLKNPNASIPLKDQRLEFINASNLRNDIEIFEFDGDAASFGLGGAQIVEVQLCDEANNPLAWVIGGEIVNLKVTAFANTLIDRPIIGFFLKDKLGQTLFGDNTYLSHQTNSIAADSGAYIKAEFSFVMPILPSGAYSFNVAIANGTQDEHVQHHWIHDALFISSTATSVSTGLIGIPMIKISLSQSMAVL